MQINTSVISKLSNNYLLGNSSTNKLKAELQKEATKIDNSNDSEEVKDAKLDNVSKKLKEITEKEKEDKLKKSSTNTDDSTEDDSEAKADRYITEGIVSASSHLKLSKVSLGVYEKAKLKGDTSKMERALKYTGSEMNKISKGEALIKKGINAYKKQLANKNIDSSNNAFNNTNNMSTNNVNNIISNDTPNNHANKKETPKHKICARA